MYYKMTKTLTKIKVIRISETQHQTLVKMKVNWKTYCKIKYGISEKSKVIYINAHDKNFDLPLNNLYKEY